PGSGTTACTGPRGSCPISRAGRPASRSTPERRWAGGCSSTMAWASSSERPR
ncbi:Corynebacterium glutamicum RXA00780-related, partial [Plasmodium yoelii yoelii]